MDADLHDLLAIWLSTEDPGEPRREQLLARLKADEPFRQAFVAEIRMLGMLKTVQSAEPRWLRLADELGWSGREPANVDSLVDRVMQKVRRTKRSRLRVGHWLSLAACVLALAGLVTTPFFQLRPNAPSLTSPESICLARVIQLDGVQWSAAQGQRPIEGGIVVAGELRLQAGRITLAFVNDVLLTMEGPAAVDIISTNRVFCRQGKLRTRVPTGAEGFTVMAPGYEVVDLGTEFGLNVQEGGKAQVMVFQGAASVSVLGADGRSIRSVLLEVATAAEVDAKASNIQEVAAEPHRFITRPEFPLRPLSLDAAYAAEIRAARPWGYWRFESLHHVQGAADREATRVGPSTNLATPFGRLTLADLMREHGRIANEIADRPALIVMGGVQLVNEGKGNHSAQFAPGDSVQALQMDGTWTPSRAGGYAIECWVQADALNKTAIVSLIQTAANGPLGKDGANEKHVALLEFTGRGRRSIQEPCTVRFLERWPAGAAGGVNVLARHLMKSDMWHHVVGQKAGESLELYIDGELVASTPAKLNADDPQSATAPCRLLVGRLKLLPSSNPNEIRAFEGRLDELAVYDRPLLREEIQHHYQMRAENR